MTRSEDAAEEEYDVTFINVSHPGQMRQRETQKAIRRRVMRDIGKTRRKRSRPITVDIVIPPSGIPRDIPEDYLASEDGAARRAQSTDIAKSLHPFGYYAIEPDARARQLFHFMHGKAGSLYRPFGMEWFASAIADRCSFYLCLANGAMFYHQMIEGGSYEYSAYDESAKYFSHCIGLVAQRLGRRDDGVSEGVITTVLGFLCHDAAVEKWDRWLIHMDGLRRIVQLRRGFSGLSSLTHLFAFWFELTGCAVLDAVPRLPIPPGLPQASVMSCEVSTTLADIVRKMASTGACCLLQACKALEQTALVADLLNKNGHKPQFWNGRAESTSILGPAAYYALSIPRMELKSLPRHHAGMQLLCEMVRLALLILVAGMKKAFSLIAGEMAAFQQKFDDLLPLTSEVFAVCPELELWCMIAVACTHGQVRPPALIMRIQEVMARMSISTAAQAIEVASSILWADAVMTTEAARRLIVDIEMLLPLDDGT